MADVQTTFKKTPSAARAYIELRENGQIKFRLRFENGDEVRTLRTGTPYSVRWRLLGSEGDQLDVDWTADDGQSGALINNFKIDPEHGDCVKYPGGPLADYGSNMLQL